VNADQLSFVNDIRYEVMPVTVLFKIKTTCHLYELKDSHRRRGYMRRLYCDRYYRNASRRAKTIARRVYLILEVPRY